MMPVSPVRKVGYPESNTKAKFEDSTRDVLRTRSLTPNKQPKLHKLYPALGDQMDMNTNRVSRLRPLRLNYTVKNHKFLVIDTTQTAEVWDTKSNRKSNRSLTSNQLHHHILGWSTLDDSIRSCDKNNLRIEWHASSSSIKKAPQPDYNPLKKLKHKRVDPGCGFQKQELQNRDFDSTPDRNLPISPLPSIFDCGIQAIVHSGPLSNTNYLLAADVRLPTKSALSVTLLNDLKKKTKNRVCFLDDPKKD
jgi:hypothetical protein